MILSGISKGKSKTQEQTFLYQSVVFYAQEISNGLFKKKTLFTFPFYSSEVFMKKEEAENFIPILIKRLVNDGSIDSRVLNDVDFYERFVKTAVHTLFISKLEIESEKV